MPWYDPFGWTSQDSADVSYGKGATELGNYHGAGLADLRAGRDAAKEAIEGGYGAAQDRFEQEAGQGYTDARFGFGAAQGAFGTGRQDIRDATGQAVGAIGAGLQGSLGSIGAGLQGGLGQLASGYGQARSTLDPYIAQDMGARSAYADALMGNDNAFWQRQSDQRMNNINRRLGAQGLLGSSSGRDAMIESETQLQNAREQQFFDRAQGLFNAGAANQAAGLAGQFGMAGADMYGRAGMAGADAYGRAGGQAASMYGDMGRGLGEMARGSAAMYGDEGRYLGDYGMRTAEGESGLLTREADQMAGMWSDYGRAGAGMAGQFGAATAGLYGNQGSTRAAENGWFPLNTNLNLGG